MGFWGWKLRTWFFQQLRFHYMSTFRPTRPLHSIADGFSRQLRHRQSPPGQATLALAFQLAPGHYPVSQATSFASAKAEFDKARMARSGVATPSNKPTIGAMGTSATAGTTTVGRNDAFGVGVGPFYQQRQITRPVGQPFANIIPTPGVPFLLVQPPVSLPQSPPHPSISPTVIDY